MQLILLELKYNYPDFNCVCVHLWFEELNLRNENIMAVCVDFEKSEKPDIKLLNNCIFNGDINYICVYI